MGLFVLLVINNSDGLGFLALGVFVRFVFLLPPEGELSVL